MKVHIMLWMELQNKKGFGYDFNDPTSKISKDEKKLIEEFISRQTEDWAIMYDIDMIDLFSIKYQKWHSKKGMFEVIIETKKNIPKDRKNEILELSKELFPIPVSVDQVLLYYITNFLYDNWRKNHINIFYEIFLKNKKIKKTSWKPGIVNIFLLDIS